jgi:two-component sensor histidine kinase
VNSSFNQEKLMQQLRSTTPSDPNYTKLAQSQKDIKDNLKTAEDSLYSISRRVPQIQSTVNKEVTAINSMIDQALEKLGDRRTAEALRNQQFAMTSMNNLALLLSEA